MTEVTAGPPRTPVPVSPLQVPNTAAAAAVLVAALDADPSSRALYPGRLRRRAALTLRMHLDLVPTAGTVIDTAQAADILAGVAVWRSPDARRRTTITTIGYGLAGLLLLLASNPAALLRLARSRQAARPAHPDEPHWTLAMIGVAPDRQAEGVGAALLRAGLERVDTTAAPCLLTTTEPRNVGYYRRFGFDVVGEHALGAGDVTEWTMWRPAVGR